jgi:hypothetical protein
MSIHSKARRDARKKKQGKSLQRTTARPIEPHATLLDEHSNLLAGAGRRGNEWVIVLAGKVVAGTDSAAMTMAMLRHMASLREREGLFVQLAYSTALKAAATAEATGEGKTLEEYLGLLEAERLDRHDDAVAAAVIDGETLADEAPDAGHTDDADTP